MHMLWSGRLPAPPINHSSQSSRPRVTFLDVCRFIAAASVLSQHSLERTDGLGRRFCEIFSPGVFGVVLFFVISGFVIPMTVGRTFDIRKFAIRRMCRIYPLVLFAFAMVAVAAWIIDLPEFQAAKTDSFNEWIANILLIQDYVHAGPILGVTWTLSLEVAWYAIFALSLRLLGRDFHERLAIAAPSVMLLLTGVSLLLGHRLPLGRIGMIYAAILGCRVYYYSMGTVSAKRILIDASLFFAVMIPSNAVSFGYFTHPTITMWQSIVPWTAAPGLFLVIGCIPEIKHSKMFNSRVLAWLGAVSFSTYLLHPIALALGATYAPAELSVAAGLTITLLFSLVGYTVIEIPGQALGKRLTAGSPIASPSTAF